MGGTLEHLFKVQPFVKGIDPMSDCGAQESLSCLASIHGPSKQANRATGDLPSFGAKCESGPVQSLRMLPNQQLPHASPSSTDSVGRWEGHSRRRRCLFEVERNLFIVISQEQIISEHPSTD